MMSDDILWDVKGFDDEIRNGFAQFFPDFSGTIHWPEKNAAKRTIIVSILGINLYKQLGHLYHPDFFSVYADNWFTEYTRHIGKYAFINKQIFLHMHPIWRAAQWDKQYRETEAKEVYARDRETYLKLRSTLFIK